MYSVTTQAHEGIETITCRLTPKMVAVTTQAHEGIETLHPDTSVLLYKVTTQAHEGIETQHPWEKEIIRRLAAYQLHRNLTSPWFAPGCPHCVFLL